MGRADRATTWHPHHIAERYGLFTIILLGESVLAASTGVDAALRQGGVDALAGDDRGRRARAAVRAVVAVLPRTVRRRSWPRDRDRSFRWGYGHYGIFAALAALGAG